MHEGPSGFRVHRTIWNHEGRGGNENDRSRSSGSPEQRDQPSDPNDTDQIMHRFFDMLNMFGAGLGPVPRPTQEDDQYSARRNFRMPGPTFGGPGHIRTFTTRTGNGGFTSFTFATGPVHIGGAGRRSPGGESGNDEFQKYVTSQTNHSVCSRCCVLVCLLFPMQLLTCCAVCLVTSWAERVLRTRAAITSRARNREVNNRGTRPRIWR